MCGRLPDGAVSRAAAARARAPTWARAVAPTCAARVVGQHDARLGALRGAGPTGLRAGDLPNKHTGAAATPSASSLARSRISRTTKARRRPSRAPTPATTKAPPRRPLRDGQPLRWLRRARGASESAWPPRLRRLSVPVGGRRCDTGELARRHEQQSRRFPVGCPLCMDCNRGSVAHCGEDVAEDLVADGDGVCAGDRVFGLDVGDGLAEALGEG